MEGIWLCEHGVVRRKATREAWTGRKYDLPAGETNRGVGGGVGDVDDDGERDCAGNE